LWETYSSRKGKHEGQRNNLRDVQRETELASDSKPSLSDAMSRGVKYDFGGTCMAQKDDYGVQSQRIILAVKKACSRCTVEFDSSRAPHWLRFRIDDGPTMLTKAHPEFHVSEVADWSDEKLMQMIETVTDRLVRQSA
jgi:hypothetical protein